MTSASIGFINPSGKYNHDPFRNQPLTQLYLLSYLEEHFGDRLDLSMIDLRGIQEEHFIQHIPEKDIFMYSVSTIDFNEAVRVVQQIRAAYPKAKHIAGGPHISFLPHEGESVFDVCAIGEGEETILQIVNDYFKSELKPLYRQGVLSDLQDVPMPSRKWATKSSVTTVGLLNKEYSDLKGTATLFSRGCPFDCHFCSNLEKGSVRYNPYHKITEEIEYLKHEYGVETLALKDDNGIPVGRKSAQPWLEAIGKAGLKWRGQSRPTGVNEDSVKMAKDSGCVEIAIGLETVEPKTMDILNKPLNLDEAKKYLRVLEKHDIGRRVHIIIGLPGEPKDVVKKTLEFIDDYAVNSVLLSLLCPLPGSAMFASPDTFGIKNITNNWDDFRVAFGSFDENERPTMTFEYKDNTPWGKPASRERIVNNYIELQHAFRERGEKF